MWLKAKITKENFDLIKSGKKTVEIRELEGMELTCGKQTIKRPISGFRLLKSGMFRETSIASDLRNALPQYFTDNENNPIVFIYLDKPDMEL